MDGPQRPPQSLTGYIVDDEETKRRLLEMLERGRQPTPPQLPQGAPLPWDEHSWLEKLAGMWYGAPVAQPRRNGGMGVR